MSVKLTFRYESFSASGMSGTSADAAAEGLIFSDTPPSEIPVYYGAISVTSAGSTDRTEYSWTPPPIEGNVADILVVAGGGGGGSDNLSDSQYTEPAGLGGGGGGGLILQLATQINNTSYTISVGAGGDTDSKGQNSTFDNLTSSGGGKGGPGVTSDFNRSQLVGGSGGSGGGGAAKCINGGRSNFYYSRYEVGGNSESTTPYLGNSGGDGAAGLVGSTLVAFGGGGGGAGDTGIDAEIGSAGNGGDGYLAFGTYYAGGGGGGSSYGSSGNGTGGLGGGGDGTGGNGTDGLGGGGGGGSHDVNGGAGGSGTVVLQFELFSTPLRSPSTISGLTGWFTGFSAEMNASNELTRWRDLSGKGNHIESSAKSGSINRSSSATNENLYSSPSTIGNKFGLTPFPFLYGSTSAGLKFPTTMMNINSNYTLFHVARYYKPGGTVPTRQRIFDGVTTNWLSGFHDGKSGVAFHGNWVTAQTNIHGDTWVLSTDQKNMYRSHGTDRTVSGFSGGTSPQLSINYSETMDQRSDWAVAEVIVYDRELDSTEYEAVEAYLNAKYFSTILKIPSTGPTSLMSFATYLFDGTGYPISLQNLASKFGLTSSIRFSNFRGQALIPSISPVQVTSADLPTQEFTVRGPSFTNTPSIKIVGANGTEYDVQDTMYLSRGVATFTIGSLTPVQLANQPFKIKIGSATSIDTISSFISLPNGITTQTINYNLSTDLGPSPYTTTGTLPHGLLIIGTSLTGTLTNDGTYNFTINSQAYRMVVTPNAAPTPTGGTFILPNGFVSENFDYDLGQDFDDDVDAVLSYSHVNGTLPHDLSINGTSLTGTPTTTGGYNFTIRATDSGGLSSTKDYGMLVNIDDPPEHKFGTGTGTIDLGTYIRNESFTIEFDEWFEDDRDTANQLVYTLESGVLPFGTQLPSQGSSTITGSVPYNWGLNNKYIFTIRATDRSGGYVTRTFSLSMFFQ